VKSSVEGECQRNPAWIASRALAELIESDDLVAGNEEMMATNDRVFQSDNM
jgi:hypothetical protein